MALQLIVDNTDYHDYLGNLLRAIHLATTNQALSDEMRDLLLAIDPDEVEEDLRVAIAINA
jgi:hypothetical protein